MVDISDPPRLTSTLDEALQRNGRLNHLIFFQRYRGSDDKWLGEMETSLTATKNVIEHVSDQFAESGDRCIVIVGSIAVDHIVSEQPVGYHVAKAGLRHLADYYAVTLGAKGIRVNCVSPCISVKEENREFYTQNEALVNLFKRTIPLGRMGTSEDAANVIMFLCSSKSAFVNGQHIVVDGGVSLLSQESLVRKISGI
jgi:NAD(P)-dependent dehydrogenase (short-subunit alcohol dehydrogenase family)